VAPRITLAHLQERCDNVNRRLASTDKFVMIERRNGHVCLDEFRRIPRAAVGELTGSCTRTIRCGTSTEMGEFLHAMMTGIDLSRSKR